jgi:hypothetical protein
LYVDVDPSDRGGGWSIALRDGLDAALGETHDAAIFATADRIRRRFGNVGAKSDDSRYHVGFVEVSAKPSREHWFDVRAPAVETQVRLGATPYLPPLVQLLDRAPRLGVVALSADLVELYAWDFGGLTKVGSYAFEAGSDGWRERKGPMVNAALGTGTSSSGRDQHEQRVEENRHRFMAHCGQRIAAIAPERGWDATICFGPDACFHHLAKHANGALRLMGSDDLVHHRPKEVAEHVTRAIARIESERESRLIDRVATAATARNGHGALGLQETLECLEAGRAEHVVYDCRRDFDDRLDEVIRGAAHSGAAITPLTGEGATALAEFGGIAALLRY